MPLNYLIPTPIKYPFTPSFAYVYISHHSSQSPALNNPFTAAHRLPDY